jgi:hypothetical protein
MTRRRRPPRGNASLTQEQVIEDFTAWLIEGGLSPEAARTEADYIREFHRETGINFLALTPEDLVGFIAACDRELEELDREEAEDLAQPDLGESKH